MASERIINEYDSTRIANAVDTLATNLADYSGTTVTPTDAMKAKLPSQTTEDRIADAVEALAQNVTDLGKSADDISYDNTTSGLPATDVQTAIDVIDAEVDEITKRLSGQSNRNLLDNPFFTINQRGQSSYSTAGKYTVDRWKLLASDNAAPDIYVNGVTLVKCAWFVQIDPDCVVSAEPKTFTMSAIIDNVLYKRTFTSIADGLNHAHSFSPIDNMIIVFTEHSSNSDGYDSLSFGFYNCTTSHTIKAVKIEEGSVSTLAYDVVPNYAEELLKCQRYYRQYSLIREDGIVYIDPTTNYPHVTKELQNVHMRTTPTATLLTNTGGFIDSVGHAYNPITSVSVTGVTANGFLVDMSTNRATTNTTPADMVSYIYDVVIALDANL